ncbi:hypothetical protein CLOSTHATH_06687 [Hungatella hathewayi DSM 13479]|uniref:Uncharacterized protein n=1 Tax=Hungatella hathewayi DSM 13479 TaxID=566550 RepID=D3ASS9_9FIRM|nr:hypothetical protein CLOSTHATH_06687 [Hungatella hathewayi DSM 13479]
MFLCGKQVNFNCDGSAFASGRNCPGNRIFVRLTACIWIHGML